MIYTKVEIAPGVELKIEVDPDEMYSDCPVCGKARRWDHEELADSLKDNWTTVVTCGKVECAIRFEEKRNDGEFE